MIDLAQLKICLIAGHLRPGGAERQLYHMLQALAEADGNVRLLCLSRGEFWEPKIRGLGVPIEWVGQSRFPLVRLMRIVRSLRRDPPDIVQSQHFYTNIYAACAAFLTGIKSIGAVRSDVYHEIRAVGSVFGYASLRLPHLIAANSQSGIRNARQKGLPGERLFYVPNFVDLEQFKPVAKPQNGRMRIIAVGWFRPEKRFDRFLRVLACVRKRVGSSVSGCLVGDGPLRLSLREQAASLGLGPDAIEFRGPMDDIAEIYKTADMLVLTSDWEGTPNVVLEAMSSGLPIVATNVGDVTDLVQHGITGCVAEPTNEDGLVEYVSRLAQSAELRARLGAAGRAHMKANFSPAALHESLMRLYAAALS